MKIILSIATALLLISTTLSAQIKNAKTEVVKVYGNCGMCKSKIEKAANQKNISKAEWNEETGIATITYDEKQTNKDVILKKIALVGYDSDAFKATNTAYNKLPGCCQYNRPKAAPVKKEKDTVVPMQ
jgi:copper chaperone CopZ